LVAKGFNQLEGIDFFKTFAPLAKHIALCLLLAIATFNNWLMKQLDVNNAFFPDDLHEGFI